MALTDKLTAIGDAIREKEGTTDLIALGDMPARIQALSTGGGDYSDDPVRQSVIKYMSTNANLLTEFVVPAGATAIAEGQFTKRYSLKNMIYEDESLIRYIYSNAFSECSDLALTTLPSGVEQIYNSAFYKCTKLALTELPSKLLKINQYAFLNCKNLQFNTFPNGLTIINAGAFSGAWENTKPAMITLPASIQTIGENCFENVMVAKFRLLGTPTAIGSSSFNSSYITDIYVPWVKNNGGAADDYAPWGASYATIHYNTSPDEVIT